MPADVQGPQPGMTPRGQKALDRRSLPGQWTTALRIPLAGSLQSRGRRNQAH